MLTPTSASMPTVSVTIPTTWRSIDSLAGTFPSGQNSPMLAEIVWPTWMPMPAAARLAATSSARVGSGARPSSTTGRRTRPVGRPGARRERR